MKNFQDKECQECKTLFKPKGPAAKFCESCAKQIRKEKSKINRDDFNRRQGRAVGVGSGGLVKKGKENHTYKSGIGSYRQIIKDAGVPFICSNCGKQLDATKRYTWCVHHIDHNRKNNELSNLQYLCKRCHQIEHECWKAFNKT